MLSQSLTSLVFRARRIGVVEYATEPLALFIGEPFSRADRRVETYTRAGVIRRDWRASPRRDAFVRLQMRDTLQVHMHAQ